MAALKPYQLTKSKVLSGLQCHKRLWLESFRKELAESSAANQLLMFNGNEIGAKARDLLSAGRKPQSLEAIANPMEAVAETQRLLPLARDGAVLFEAAFLHAGVLVRADAIRLEAGQWQLVEVKSSTRVKDYQLRDIAVQAWAIEGAGLPLASINLAHVDNGFVYRGDGDYTGLLAVADVSEPTRANLGAVRSEVQTLLGVLESEEPNITMGEHCDEPFECPFKAHCRAQLPPGPQYPVDILPRGKKLAAELRAEGYEDLTQVPLDRLKNDLHRKVARASRTEQAELSPEAGRILRQLAYPRYYLDFESIGLAVPRWPGVRPYQQVTFQWSCHIEAAAGAELQHREFLDLSGADPSRPFVESLLAAVGDAGPILVYNASFECGRLQELAERLPEHRAAIERVITRVVDLLPIAREHYYHPAMMGSWSIKKVLPTIAPELDYGKLEGVQDGGDAQNAYLGATSVSIDSQGQSQQAIALRRYCELDTRALALLGKSLSQL